MRMLLIKYRPFKVLKSVHAVHYVATCPCMCFENVRYLFMLSIYYTEITSKYYHTLFLAVRLTRCQCVFWINVASLK